MTNPAEKYILAIELTMGRRDHSDPSKTLAALRTIDLVAHHDAELKADHEAACVYYTCHKTALEMLDGEFDAAIQKVRAALAA